MSHPDPMDFAENPTRRLHIEIASEVIAKPDKWMCDYNPFTHRQ